MYTYVQRPGCKKENTATYVHTGGVLNAYSRIRTARARVHGWVGMEKLRRRRFMGRQRKASCSSGGNGTRVVHREPTSLDGTADGNEAWRTAERRKQPCVRSATFETGSCSSGGEGRTTKRYSTRYCSSSPSTSSNLHGLLSIHRRPPPASTCDCSSTGSCSSSLHRALLHRLLFNHPSPHAPV